MVGGAKNKRKGTAYEHQCAQVLRMLSFYVLRAYSSVGTADLVASPPWNSLGNNRTLLIQCKNSTTRKDYIPPFERAHLDHLQQTNAGIVVVMYKDETNCMVKVWDSQEKMTFEKFMGITYGIKCDFKDLLKNYQNQRRPLVLFPPPKEENDKFIAPFGDFYDLNIYYPHVSEKYRK